MGYWPVMPETGGGSLVPLKSPSRLTRSEINVESQSCYVIRSDVRRSSILLVTQCNGFYYVNTVFAIWCYRSESYWMFLFILKTIFEHLQLWIWNLNCISMIGLFFGVSLTCDSWIAKICHVRDKYTERKMMQNLYWWWISYLRAQLCHSDAITR